MSSVRFDAAWQRRRRWARWWASARWFVVLGLLLAGAALVQEWSAQGEWEPIDTRFVICGEESAAACVVDGDSLVIGKRRIRLTGFDTPEMFGRCEAERLLARQARKALADWLSEAPFELDGGADPPRDRYGRELRAARRNDGGEWLADRMIRAGLARDNGWGSRAEWC